jgi:hypothetical protein
MILARLEPLAVVGGMGLAAVIAPDSSRGIALACIASDFPPELSDACAAARVLLALRGSSLRAAGAASSFDGDRP